MRVANESYKADAERRDTKSNRQGSLERGGRSIEWDSRGPGRIYRPSRSTRPARPCAPLSVLATADSHDLCSPLLPPSRPIGTPTSSVLISLSNRSIAA